MPRFDFSDHGKSYRQKRREFLATMAYNVGRGVYHDVKRVGKAYGVPIMVGGVKQAIGATLGSAFNTPDQKNKRKFSAPSAPKKSQRGHFNSRVNPVEMPNLRAEMDVENEDQSKKPISLKRKYLHSMVHTEETNQLTRLSPCTYRLHSAKAVNLPGMLNDLFMPKLTSKLSFGFTSNTGFGKVFPFDSPANTVTGIAGAAPRGNYRGVSLLKFRFTDKDVTRTATDALNATLVARPSKIDGEFVNSHYRNFHSAPVQANAGSQAAITQTSIQTITSSENLTSAGLRQLGVGANLTHFEDHAYQATNFLQSVGQANSSYNIGTSDTEDVTDWNGLVPILQGDGNENAYYYPQNAKEGIMRISDGFVEFDISNSSKTACVVEIVLHSMKKTAVDINSPEVYKQLYNSFDYYTKSQFKGNELSNANKPGGWQTFYDPKVPLLSLPGKYAKPFNNLATEVHRSNHILGVGQSKVVKISLGSLYYKLGNKSDSIISNEPDNLKTYTKRDNAGTILCAIGHTGFDALESLAVPGDTVTNTTLGNGLWAGKSPTPSSLVVSGLYQEQYYPMYMYTTGRILGNFGIPRPAGVAAEGISMGLPQNIVMSTSVATIPADQVGAPIAAEATAKP